MARRYMGGAEAQSTLLDGLTTAGTVSINTSNPHSGGACYEFASGASNRAFVQNMTFTDNTWSYHRVWIWFSGNPSADTLVAAVGSSTNYHQAVTLTTTGAFKGPDGTTGSPVAAGWHCIEIGARYDGVQNHNALCRIDGVQLGAQRNDSLVQPIDRFTFGNPLGIVNGITLRADDFAINDDSGATQNSWPGTTGKVALALPTADSADGADWKLGDGTTALGGNAFAAIKAVPPAGVASASATTTSQIKDAINNATSPNADTDVTVQSYTVAGATAGSVVTAVCAVAAIGSGNASSCTLATRLVSNPADGAEVTAASPTGGAGAYPTGWAAVRGTLTSTPTVLQGTGPVVRVGKRTLSTIIGMSCFVGVSFEYDTPATGDGQYIQVGVNQPTDIRATGKHH